MKYFTLCVVVFWSLLGCSSSGARAPVSDLTLNSNSVKAISSTKKNASKQKLKRYKVKAGDTLYAIAWKTHLDVKTLAKLNSLKPPYIIHQGDSLNLTVKKKKKISQTKKTTLKSEGIYQEKDKTKSKRCAELTCPKKSEKSIVHIKPNEHLSINAGVKVSPKNIKSKGKQKITVWRWPAKGRLTKTFSSSQVGMKGISLSNQRGTSIYAATSGQVVYAGDGLRGYGNLIIIKHNYDYLSAYAHNEQLLVNENEVVKVGQKIATMGNSGTESVHLHFEIRYRGKSVDPLRYLPGR